MTRQQFKLARDLATHHQALLGVRRGLQRLAVAGHQRQRAGEHRLDAWQLVFFDLVVWLR
jgi:hypothetical protein